MTTFVHSLEDIIHDIDVVVLDQWGVLHDGSTPYPHAARALEMLHRKGKPIVIVSNSGKRAELNAERIAGVGLKLPRETFVLTSGEALWRDITHGKLRIHGKQPDSVFPICAHHDDAVAWADGAVRISSQIDDDVDTVLVMGLRDNTTSDACDDVLRQALMRQLPVICSNPDKSSPRRHGLVTSPGAIADRYAELGGTVLWYGKPHTPIFEAVTEQYPQVARQRFLMVGDSLEHDIAGAHAVGFRSALVLGGLHAPDFRDNTSPEMTLTELTRQHSCQPPDFALDYLR